MVLVAQSCGVRYRFSHVDEIGVVFVKSREGYFTKVDDRLARVVSDSRTEGRRDETGGM
jgi:hypothetical protein